MCRNVKLQARGICHTKRTDISRISTNKSRNSAKGEAFVAALEKCLPGPQNKNSLERWENLRDAAYTSAMSVFGKQTNKSADWFEANAEDIRPAFEAKRFLVPAYKTTPSKQNLLTLREARSKVQ